MAQVLNIGQLQANPSLVTPGEDLVTRLGLLRRHASLCRVSVQADPDTNGTDAKGHGHQTVTALGRFGGVFAKAL